jgi:hypothetical protein
VCALESSTTRFIARISGLPATAIDALASPLLHEAANSLAAIVTDLGADAVGLSVALHHEIGLLAEKSARNRLLELRRDLLAARLPSGNRLEVARTLLSAEAMDLVERQCAKIEERARRRERTVALHTTELLRSRSAFQRAIADHDFQKGVLASSVTLYQNISRYRDREPASFVSRDEQIERGLLRYFTRASMKATPFARFCTVVQGELVKGARAGMTLEGDVAHKLGFIRLNKLLLARLWSHLKTRPRVRSSIPLEVNQTLAESDGHYRYLASFDGREVVQRIRCDEALTVVVDILNANPGLTATTLAAKLAASAEFDATEHEAAAYVESVVGADLFRLRPLVPEQEADWVNPLERFLESIEDDDARATVTLLGELRLLKESFNDATPEQRLALTERVKGAVSDCFRALGIDSLSPGDLLLYEDASLNATFRITDSDAVESTLQATAALGCLMARVSAVRAEQMTMRRFFDVQYVSERRVPLLTFFEDYYRNHLKAHLERQRRIHTGQAEEQTRSYDQWNPLRVDSVDELWQSVRAVSEHLRDRWAGSPEEEEIDVSSAALEQQISGVPSGDCSFVSCSTFGQLLFDEKAGQWRFVLSRPTFFAGYGKYFSRFLYVLPATFLSSVRETNSKMSTDVLAEIGGDSHFNGNLHPPLLPLDISHPSGRGASGHESLSVTDLEVERDPRDSGSLLLVRRSDSRRVYPVDLGFLNPGRRSPLYRLLANFGPMTGSQVIIPESKESHPQQLANENRGGSRSARLAMIEYRPRFVVDGRVVLSRRRWKVPGALFPAVRRDESQADHFVRVSLWRIECGIPCRAYVRVVAHSGRAVDGENAIQSTAESSEEQPDESRRDFVVRSAVQSSERTFAGRAIPSTAEAQGTSASLETRVGVANKEAGGRSSTRERRGVPGRAEARLSRDYHKPQFIDFSSPMLVALLGRLPYGLEEFHAEFEEAYPGSGHLLAVDGAHYATELVVQFDRPASGDCSSSPSAGAELAHGA